MLVVEAVRGALRLVSREQGNVNQKHILSNG